MTLVKICGLTRVEDAVVAAENGSDFLGFIFAENSKRKISIQVCKKAVSEIHKITNRKNYEEFIWHENNINETTEWFINEAKNLVNLRKSLGRSLTVGVFQNQTREYIKKIVEDTGIDLIQLHGNEEDHLCLELKRPIIKTISVSEETTLDYLRNLVKPNYYNYILLDTKTKHGSGGTGQVFDWSLASNLGIPVIVAGGLNPKNLDQLLQVKPFGVDVSSGVEREVGVKDHSKLREFLNQIHDVEN